MKPDQDNLNSHQQDNNSGNIGREVEEERREPLQNHAPNPQGIAENEKHWKPGDTGKPPKSTDTEIVPREPGQISHAENTGGTSAEDI